MVEISDRVPHYLFYSGLDQGQYLSLVTPIFLHFGLMHLAFNCIWLAMLGSKIEQQQGSIHLFLLVVACGAASNIVQYEWSGSILWRYVRGDLCAAGVFVGEA